MADFGRVARLSDLPPGRMVAVRLESEDLVLYNVDGAIFASRDFCPHAGYALSKSNLCSKYVRCSLHSWQFACTSREYKGKPKIQLVEDVLGLGLGDVLRQRDDQAGRQLLGLAARAALHLRDELGRLVTL